MKVTAEMMREQVDWFASELEKCRADTERLDWMCATYGFTREAIDAVRADPTIAPSPEETHRRASADEMCPHGMYATCVRCHPKLPRD